MRVLLDTNVLVRLANPDDAGHQLAVAAIERLVEAGNECVLVPQVLYEFWVVATRPLERNGLGFAVGAADRAVEDQLLIFPLLLDERGIFTRWREIVRGSRVEGKQAHDARLVAAMHRHDVKSMLTFNAADFRRFNDILVRTPDDFRSETD